MPYHRRRITNATCLGSFTFTDDPRDTVSPEFFNSCFIIKKNQMRRDSFSFNGQLRFALSSFRVAFDSGFTMRAQISILTYSMVLDFFLRIWSEQRDIEIHRIREGEPSP